MCYSLLVGVSLQGQRRRFVVPMLASVRRYASPVVELIITSVQLTLRFFMKQAEAQNLNGGSDVIKDLLNPIFLRKHS